MTIPNRCRLAHQGMILMGVMLAAAGLRSPLDAAEPVASTKRPRLLLLFQKPDGHPEQTHEYQAGLQELRELLPGPDQLDVRLVAADEPWQEGPALLDGADAVVLFLAEGARWVSANPERLQALERLAARGGGLSCLHWAMGARAAEPVPKFLALFGGCHGGPDRKYRFLATTLRRTMNDSEITAGLEPLHLKEEFYYDLKWSTAKPGPQPLMEAEIDGRWWPVAWNWERPEGGRSFGFSGLHYHDNWQQPAYRQFLARGVMWTLPRQPASASNSMPVTSP